MARVKASKDGGYRDAPVDVTETGIGKNYNGFRIFHTKKTGAIDHITNDLTTRPVTAKELARFGADLKKAAAKDPKVAEYLREMQSERDEAARYKPEPEQITR